MPPTPSRSLRSATQRASLRSSMTGSIPRRTRYIPSPRLPAPKPYTEPRPCSPYSPCRHRRVLRTKSLQQAACRRACAFAGVRPCGRACGRRVIADTVWACAWVFVRLRPVRARMRACMRAACTRCTGRFHPKARAAAGRRAAADCPSCDLARSSRPRAAVFCRRARRAAARAASETQRRFCRSRRSRGLYIGERERCRRRDWSRRRRQFGPPVEPGQRCRDHAPPEQGEWRHLHAPIKQRECWRRLRTPVKHGERQRVHAPAHERLRWRVPARLGPMGSASRDRRGRVRWAKWDCSTGLRACFRYGAR